MVTSEKTSKLEETRQESESLKFSFVHWRLSNLLFPLSQAPAASYDVLSSFGSSVLSIDLPLSHRSLRYLEKSRHSRPKSVSSDIIVIVVLMSKVCHRKASSLLILHWNCVVRHPQSSRQCRGRTSANTVYTVPTFSANSLSNTAASVVVILSCDGRHRWCSGRCLQRTLTNTTNTVCSASVTFGGQPLFWSLSWWRHVARHSHFRQFRR